MTGMSSYYRTKDDPPLGRVYFVLAGPHLKIGWSASPESRVASLQTGNAHEFDLIGSVMGSEEDERALHAAFAHLRERGEWFRADPAFVAHLRWISQREARFDQIDQEALIDRMAFGRMIPLVRAMMPLSIAVAHECGVNASEFAGMFHRDRE